MIMDMRLGHVNPVSAGGPRMAAERAGPGEQLRRARPGTEAPSLRPAARCASCGGTGVALPAAEAARTPSAAASTSSRRSVSRHVPRMSDSSAIAGRGMAVGCLVKLTCSRIAWPGGFLGAERRS